MIPRALHKKWLQFGFNLFPCFRRTGARIVYISDDFRQVRVRLPLNWKTKGYFGTTFGGSIYASIDPIYMVMLNRLLGSEFLVWDKSAAITFRKPGRGALTADFNVSESDTIDIIETLEHSEKMDKVYTVQLVDPDGEVCAQVEKTMNIRRRRKKSNE